jgi:hypothetical protein
MRSNFVCKSHAIDLKNGRNQLFAHAKEDLSNLPMTPIEGQKSVVFTLFERRIFSLIMHQQPAATEYLYEVLYRGNYISNLPTLKAKIAQMNKKLVAVDNRIVSLGKSGGYVIKNPVDFYIIPAETVLSNGKRKTKWNTQAQTKTGYNFLYK